MPKTVGEACVEAQRAYEASKAAAEERRRVFARAIERGATYRELAGRVGVSPNGIFNLVRDVVRPRSPLDEPWEDAA